MVVSTCLGVALIMNWHECFTYNDDGSLTWKRRPRRHFKNEQAYSAHYTNFFGKKAGSVAYNRKTGYRWTHVRIGGISAKVSKVVWEMHNGPVPSGMEIDHRDGNSMNDRIGNLRLATRGQNNANTRVIKRTTTGRKGVSRTKYNTFAATIGSGKNGRYLGSFKTLEDAGNAYDTAAEERYGEFALSARNKQP